MSNELTIIRFRTADDRTLPAISPESLSRITSAMQQLFVRAAQVEGQTAQVQFTFSVAPRKGSLEIVLAHALELRAAAHEPQSPRLAGTRRTTPAEKTRSDYAGWTSAGLSAAALIYTAVFGGQGLVEAFANDRPKPERAASDDPVDVVKFRLITAPQDRTQLAAHVRSLVQAAAESGAATVEIEILDEPAVLVFSEESRKLPGALTRRAALQKADVEIRKLREFDAGRYGGSLLNAPITVVTAKADAVQGTVAVIWKSKKAIPTQRSDTAEVRARFATPSDLMHLRMDDSLPLRFDEVAAVIIVDGVAEYE